ncbi:MAG: alpha/beta hydrolase [Candidatus Krumholzibacteriota bacterium]|nr:alpha/beta hydrolase [Candidatus Krumholzibacteriota bacterium]
MAPRQSLPAALATALLLLAAACSDEPAGPDDSGTITPAYILQTGPRRQSEAFGWALAAGPLVRGGTSHAETYAIPRRPFRTRVERTVSQDGAAWRHDWTLGPDTGPVLRAAFAKEDGGAWAWARTGWGELDLRHDLAPAYSEAFLIDPRGPLGFAFLGWAWEDAGRPDSLDLHVALLATPGGAPNTAAVRLHYDGPISSRALPAPSGGLPTGEREIALEAFHMALGDDPLYFKLMADHFPTPYVAWWERDGVYLQFWGEEPPDLSDQDFDPAFPGPAGYTVQTSVVAAGDLTLAVERRLPDGAGPFPTALLMADDGPADRDDAALFGHLAHDLATAGWLVYRWDKGGTGLSTGDLDSLDLGGRRRALEAVWQAAALDADADPARRVLVGHGEGAALALERAADDPGVAGVVALAPLLYDPDRLPDIPEAELAAGDWIDFLGLDCFVDKHRDLLDFDGADFLPAVTCPVALYYGDADSRAPVADLEAQAALLAAADLDAMSFPGLDHWLNNGRADDPPAPELVARILDWLAQEFPDEL